MSFLILRKKTEIIYINSINRLAFIIDILYIFCEVATEFLNVILATLTIQWLKEF
jgi:hypothetical protein